MHCTKGWDKGGVRADAPARTMRSERKNMKKANRDERIRNELFPGSENSIFNTKNRGFVPTPIEWRLLLRFLTPPQCRVLLYLQLRTGKEGICFPTVEEIAHDLGVSAAKNVRPHLKALEEKGFIRSGRKGGRTYYLMHDPSVAITRLVKRKEMSAEYLRDVNDLRENLGREPIAEEGD